MIQKDSWSMIVVTSDGHRFVAPGPFPISPESGPDCNFWIRAKEEHKTNILA